MRKLLILFLVILSYSCGAATIKLTPNNHYFLSERVDQISMALAASTLEAMDAALPKGEPLYLVLKTPGGSVIAGMQFISRMNNLSRPITTVSIQSISMGFQIVQALGKRFVAIHGILMTHPIAGTCQGRIPEIKSCLNFIQQLADSMDVEAAKRMRMSLKKYQELSSEEWYTVGIGAVLSNMADEVANIRCDKQLIEKGTCPN